MNITICPCLAIFFMSMMIFFSWFSMLARSLSMSRVAFVVYLCSVIYGGFVGSKFSLKVNLNKEILLTDFQHYKYRANNGVINSNSTLL